MRYHASSFAFVSTLSNVHVHTLKASSKGEKVPASWSHHDDPLPLTPAAEAGSRGPCPGGTVSKVAWLCIYIQRERGGFDSSSKNEPRLKIHRTQIVSSTIREFRFIHLRVSAIPFLLLLLFCTFISSYNLLLSYFASDF